MNKEKQKNPFIKESQLKEFNKGNNFKSYEFLGANYTQWMGISGYSFAVWAPNAKSVSVVGDFNDWDKEKNIMNPQGKSGVWHCFIKEAEKGQKYKYLITGNTGEEIYKADPYAKLSELRPNTA